MVAEPVEPDDLQHDRAPFIPTPEQIRLGCLEIQATWSPVEEQSRRVIGNPLVEMRAVREPDG